MDFPDKKYGAVMLDPPWAFKTYDGKDLVPTQGAQPYDTTQLNEIAGLPIPRILAGNAALFLWDNDSLPRTLPFLAEAWGLRIATKNVFVWDKGERIGMGYYTRKQAEVCHLLVRGKPKVKAHDVRQVIREPRREHSRKPEDARTRIEALFDGPYLEVFGRQSRPGWDVIGDQADLFDEGVFA